MTKLSSPAPTNRATAAPWSLFMRWHDLLFAHWPISPSALRPLIPSALELDTLDGTAWLGLVPFRMAGIRHRRVPAVPGFRAFPELNVRTYVTRGGRPGVWFFSLDAAHAIAAATGRWTYHLPYFWARIRCARDGAGVAYDCRRIAARGEVRLRCRYRPIGPPAPAKPATLDHFLTERYSLYSIGRGGRLFRAEIEHAPWPLQPAEWQVEENTMTAPLGIDLPGAPPRLLFARKLEVVAGRLTPA